jgi:hypothetical protein
VAKGQHSPATRRASSSAPGRRHDAIIACRRSLEQLPSLGEAYWSLANLKTYCFGGAEVVAMQNQLARSHLADEDRSSFPLVLGKEFEGSTLYRSF